MLAACDGEGVGRTLSSLHDTLCRTASIANHAGMQDVVRLVDGAMAKQRAAGVAAAWRRARMARAEGGRGATPTAGE